MKKEREKIFWFSQTMNVSVFLSSPKIFLFFWVDFAPGRCPCRRRNHRWTPYQHRGWPAAHLRSLSCTSGTYLSLLWPTAGVFWYEKRKTNKQTRSKMATVVNHVIKRVTNERRKLVISISPKAVILDKISFSNFSLFRSVRKYCVGMLSHTYYYTTERSYLQPDKNQHSF